MKEVVKPSAVSRSAKKPSRPIPGTREVAEWMYDRIRRGLLRPGQRLIEADISRQTGAARGHVREALRRLEAESIVVIEEFRGASVRQYTQDDVQQIYEVRMALEGVAAANFAAADLPEEKQQLAALQREMNRHVRESNYEQFARANDKWHALIIDSAGNEHLKQFLLRLKIPMYRLLHRSFFKRARLDTSNAGHRKITAAILAGKPKDAERCMRAHVSDGRKMIMAMME